MNSLVSICLNFRLARLPRLNFFQPYFQFPWIGFFCASKPVGLNCFLPPLVGAAKVGTHLLKAKLFWTFFAFFFLFLSNLSTCFLTLVSKADANVQPPWTTFQISDEVFFNFFSKPPKLPHPQYFNNSTFSPPFQSGCKCRAPFFHTQAFWEKNESF